MKSRMLDREKLKKGYTTGTCAAGAAKAAIKLLYENSKDDSVEVQLPSGKYVTLPICSQELDNGNSWCCIKKDAGDDPDVTHGTLICARAKKYRLGIKIKGGEGVGRITKPGLKVPVGHSAINPIPMEMIEKNVAGIIPPGTGAEIQIYVPEGEELAKKTLNNKLGIQGGISIIGTTGIVEPWSDEAFMRSLSPQIEMAIAAGFNNIVLTPGNIGERNAVKMGIPEDAVVQMGNYVGYMLEECSRKGIKKAIIFGSQGKIIKVSGGIFNTHSKIADAKLEILAANTALMGGNKDTLKRIMESTNTENAYHIIKENNLTDVYGIIAKKASERAMEYVSHNMEIGTVILSNKGKILGYDNNAIKNPKFGRIIKGI